MLQSRFSLYLGKQRVEGYSGFFADANCFLVLEAEQELTKEESDKFFTLLKEKLNQHPPAHLIDLEDKIHQVVMQVHLPVNFSLSCCYIKDKVIYLTTIGSGKILLLRKEQLNSIIEGNNNASGYIEEKDFFILTTPTFNSLYDEENLREILHKEKPQTIIEQEFPNKQENDEGAVALFIYFHSQEVKMKAVEENLPLDDIQSVEKKKTAEKLKPKIEFDSQTRRKIIMVTVFILLALLIWSVGLGYQRRKDAEQQKKIQAARDLITHKLSQADDVAFLNMNNALELINQSKQTYQQLQGQVGTQHKEELATLAQKIQEEEDKITKKEDKKTTEFFDLTVDNKNAVGTKVALDGSTLAILDNRNGIIYLLSLDKKSLDKRTDASIKDSHLLLVSQDTVFFNNQMGDIYQIDSNNKVKKVITKDSEWGTIIDMQVYNSNLYLLDQGKNQIYKYIATDKGYADKASYLKSNADLQDANSLAIDSAIYIGLSDHVAKFVAGVQDSFNTTFPNGEITLSKVVTNKDLNNIFVWDKKKGTVYVLDKNGTYEKQVQSSQLTKADDITVYGKSIFLLSGAKIYTIDY